MKKLLVVIAGAGAAIGASLPLINTGVAGAAPPDVSGDTFSEAQAALKESGYTAVMSTTLGDKLAQGDCKVVRQETTTASAFVGGDVSAPSSNPKVRLSLHCNPEPKSSSESH